MVVHRHRQELLGVGLADDVVSGADEELKDSLRSDLDEAEDALDGQLWA